MWRESFETGVGVSDPDPLDEQKQYFLTEVLQANAVRLAVLAREDRFICPLNSTNTKI